MPLFFAGLLAETGSRHRPQWEVGIHGPRWREGYLYSLLPNLSAIPIRISAFRCQETTKPLQPSQRLLSVERPFRSALPCPSFPPQYDPARIPVQRHGENEAIHGFAGFTGTGCCHGVV